MTNDVFFWPVFAMIALTAAVWGRMYVVRIAEMREKRIHPQSVATSGTKGKLENTQAADNFNNLLEMPVLFYLLSVILMMTNLGNLALLTMAWLFVLLRVVHSGIQCGYNKVMHRFKVYVASSLVLFAMWVTTAARVATVF